VPVLPVNWHLLDGGVCRVEPQIRRRSQSCLYSESCNLTEKLTVFCPIFQRQDPQIFVRNQWPALSVLREPMYRRQ